MPSPAIASTGCRDAGLLPTSANLTRIRAALACVVNHERTERGRTPLRENARLRRAAAGHSAQMVHDGYYAHDSANGQSFARRIVAARYVTRRDNYVLGENLAWSAGELSTPEAVVAAWLRTPTQRANLLDRQFRDFGIGVHAGVPQNAAAGATYTVDFGLKR